uniref:Uncharacterized protein n=1 Tax=Cacopsylla melanoneura TaxID=428564 RepID=A0A8D8ZEQ3_9HEMI
MSRINTRSQTSNSTDKAMDIFHIRDRLKCIAQTYRIRELTTLTDQVIVVLEDHEKGTEKAREDIDILREKNKELNSEILFLKTKIKDDRTWFDTLVSESTEKYNEINITKNEQKEEITKLQIEVKDLNTKHEFDKTLLLEKYNSHEIQMKSLINKHETNEKTLSHKINALLIEKEGMIITIETLKNTIEKMEKHELYSIAPSHPLPS